MTMARIGAAVMAVSFLAAGCVAIKADLDTHGTHSCARGGSVLRHVVLFKYRDGTTEAQAAEIKQRFLELKNKIDGILCIEGNGDVSPGDRTEGYTHCFIVTFTSAAARDAYIPHPAHQGLATSLKPYVEKVLVIDFWAEH